MRTQPSVADIIRIETERRAASRFAHPELIIRPWVSPIVPSVREPRAPDLVTPEAFIEWGDASEFAENTFRSDASHVSIRVEDDDDEPERQRYNYSEEGRAYSDYMVTNEQDPDSYVVMRITTAAAFSGPDGAQFILSMSAAGIQPGTQTGSGQSPPAPPSLDELE